MSSEKRPPAPRRKEPRQPRHEYHSRHHRPRRKKIDHAVRISILSCFIAAASPEYGEPRDAPAEDGECTAPRVVKFDLKNLLSPLAMVPQPTKSPRVTPQLGDGIRSSEASGVFFDSLDSDGDGAIEPEEVAMFLQNEIGGQQFDTQVEVDEEVGTIMESLDQNQNNGLEMSDMLDYWMKLESLLTAEEVSEWIVYSVQLPSSIGKTFLENGITGYDFLEIVDNGGEVLENELGIEKASFRNKIVRQMQARMLGIGSSPGAPKQFTHRLESCTAITLKWDRSTARVFPVHSYRLQRRAINLFGSESVISNNFDSLTASSSEWKTVYVGGENECVDSGLDTGHTYMYRIQAWNSVGRSGWESIDLTRDLRKHRCSTKPPKPEVERGMPPIEVGVEWEWISTSKRTLWGIVAFVQVIYHSVRFFLAFLALLAGMMRFRRATATSSASAHTILPFPWFWNSFNRLWMKAFGHELIPRTMLGDREAIMRQEQMHDERIAAKGLRGYDRLRRKAQAEEVRNGSAGVSHIERRSAFKKEKSFSTGDLLCPAASFTPPKEVMIPREGDKGGTPNKFGWMRRRGPSSIGHNSEPSETCSAAPTLSSRGISMSRSNHPSLGSGRKTSCTSSDDSQCSECGKRFKFGKRYKHHCSRCMATFCHKHGRTTHSNFTSCRVPGDCMCNTCLNVLELRISTISDHPDH